MKRIPALMLLVLSTIPVTYGLEITQVGVYDFGVAYDIAVQGDYAYLSGNDGVDVFDITDRSNPVKLTRITCSSNGAIGLYISDDTLYICATSNGLMIMDISDPGYPETVGTVSGIDAIDVYVSQGYAYVASGTSFSIIDIGDRSNPEITATMHVDGTSYHIHAVQDTLYLGEIEHGLMVYDITDPATPSYIRTVPSTTGIFDIESKADTLYLACHGYGVKILDITDRQNPQIIGSHNNGGEAYGVYVQDNLLMVADLQQGIEVLDVSNPRSPTLEARWTSTYPHEIAGDSQYVYLADQDDGLKIFMYGDDLEAQTVDTSTPQTADNQIPINIVYVIAGIAMLILFRRKVNRVYSCP